MFRRFFSSSIIKEIPSLLLPGHESERLSKLISSTGYCSRRDADKLISQGVVFVNGVEAKIATKVTESDSVFVEGIRLRKGIVHDFIHITSFLVYFRLLYFTQPCLSMFYFTFLNL